MWLSILHSGCTKHSTRPSTCLSVPCLRITRNQKAIETENLVMETWYEWLAEAILRSKDPRSEVVLAGTKNRRLKTVLLSCSFWLLRDAPGCFLYYDGVIDTNVINAVGEKQTAEGSGAWSVGWWRTQNRGCVFQSLPSWQSAATALVD